MSLAELAPALHALPRTDKILALQLLSADLSLEGASAIVPGEFYPVFSPEAPQAAEDVLMNLLREGGDS